MLRSLTGRLTVAAAPLLFAGCTVGPDYRPASPAELGVPDRYSVPADARPTGDLSRWWANFDDPLLQSLVERTSAANLDIATAVTRLRQARESLLQSRADLYPRVSGSGGYSRTVGITGGGTSTVTLPDGTTQSFSTGGSDNNFSIGADVAYQVGLFGEVRRTVEASRAQYQASGFDYVAVLISSQAEVARNYILARLYQAQLASARDSLALQDDNLEIAGFRVQAGLVSSLDVEQARLQRAQTAASIPQIEQSYNAAVSRLGVLTGQAPGALKAEMAISRPIPRGPDQVGAGIPADTLRQRPDVLGAERALAAATAQIGVAKAQLYPALAISGSIGADASALGDIADAITGRLFAGLTQIIFDGGRIRSQVRSTEAAAQGALLSYRGTVLAALEDVENAIAALAASQAREQAFAVALDAATNFALLSRSQYRAGLTDFTTLNQAESGLLSARNSVNQARADKASALVALYLALGGGWQPGPAPEVSGTAIVPAVAAIPVSQD